MKKTFISLLIVLAIAAGGVVIWRFNYLQKLTTPFERRSTSTASSPEQVTEKFYTWYIGCLEETVGTEKAPCQWQKSDYVNDKLTKNIGGNGYDPIICAQNLPDTSKGSVVVKKAEISDNKAKAVIYSLYNWENRPIEVDLERINNQWKITALACPPTQTPDYIVGNFYASYINCQGGQVEAGSSLPGYCLYGEDYSGSSKELFTELAENYGGSPELIKNIKWMPGADPILCAQDIPQSIRIENVNVVGDDASVTVIEDFATPILIQVDLKLHRVLESRSWQIVNVTCQEQP